MKRKLIQVLSTLVHNPFLPGLIEGRLYRGQLKNLCVPGLNCYSCPAAAGACPLGALQSVAAQPAYAFSFYASGILMLFGIILGRAVCGWLCPFGLVQEILYKFCSKKYFLPGWTMYIKYILLFFLVFLLPALWANELGMGTPVFCKYICPAGTLEGGIPLLAAIPALRVSLGYVFIIKFFILIAVILGSILIFRPFCRVLCPLGAIYSFFNRVSVYRYQVDGDKCSGCGSCARACKMQIKPHSDPNNPECIRCGDCLKACSQQAIRAGLSINENDGMSRKPSP